MPIQRQAVVGGRDLFADLSRALAHLRDGPARVMAGHLVRRDHRRELVALTDGGEAAVFYDPLARHCVAVPFDDRGLADGARRSPWRGVESPAPWVAAHADDLAWVHPRYRWAAGRSGDRSAWRRQ